MLDEGLAQRLAQVRSRFEELEGQLADLAIASDPEQLRTLGKEHAELTPLVKGYAQYESAEQDLRAAREMLGGATGDDASFLRAEIERLQGVLEDQERELRALLVPKDPRDERDVIVEIRAGTGGDEAGLWARELFEMYQRYAESRRWKTETLSLSTTGVGGIKEAIFGIKGKGAYSRMKYESGGHRVQRVPETESQGRIHTSAATVAVLPEAEEVDVQIDPKDLDIVVYRSSGPGGQSVNTTDSAVRITHKPTGEVVACQDERSQLQNKERALRILRARLLERAQKEQRAQIAAERKSQVGSGDRSDRIRTYNFPQNRVTDHRIGLSVHKLPQVLEGDLDDIIDALAASPNNDATT
jgi:peptide chain release factor 1